MLSFEARRRDGLRGQVFFACDNLALVYISIRRTVESDAPLDLTVQIMNDWSHFKHLHRKSHREFRLLHKEGNREIFLYKARYLFPLPFGKSFIVFREYTPETKGWRQFYYDIKSGRVNYNFTGVIEREDGSVVTYGNCLIPVSPLWRLFPRLFVWLFKVRVDAVADEDEDMMRERINLGGFDNRACAPPDEASYDFIRAALKDGLPEAFSHFEVARRETYRKAAAK